MNSYIFFTSLAINSPYLSRCLLYLGLTIFILMPKCSVLAQPAACDEGVIRLPDRSGTIQICSAFAARVPQLSQQIADVSKLLGSQQAQIQTLTKLVKGLNGLSQSLSDERQAQMLLNLAKELDRSSKRGDSSNRRNFESLVDRVDELSSVISKIAATPAGEQAIADSMAGGMGDTISRLEFGSALSQLEEISAQLKKIGEAVTDIKRDTSIIREDVRRMEAQSISALKAIAAEIRSLGNQGGLVANPKSYAELYHNARILAQRGEFDLAAKSYEKLFSFALQMADPIDDVVTLARRLYGVKGARSFIDQKLKHKMQAPSYLYAQLLMADLGREKEFEYEFLADTRQWLSAAQQFPPIALQLLKMEEPHKSDYREFAWTKWRFFFDLHKVLDVATSSGDFLAYYVDQLRGGAQMDAYSKEKMAPFFEELFLFVLPNSDMPVYAFEHERYLKSNVANRLINEFRLVDIEKSPAVLDFTYFQEEPLLIMESQYFKWRWHRGAPKRESGLIRVSLWDPFIDKKQPVQVCSDGNRSGDFCLNLNSDEFSCNRLPGMHAFSERYKCFTVYGNVMESLFKTLPNADATFSPQEWLKAECISKITYTDGNGVKVVVSSEEMVATHRWSKGRTGNSEIESLIRKCGYQNQSAEVAEKGWRPFRNSF